MSLIFFVEFRIFWHILILSVERRCFKVKKFLGLILCLLLVGCGSYDKFIEDSDAYLPCMVVVDDDKTQVCEVAIEPLAEEIAIKNYILNVQASDTISLHFEWDESFLEQLTAEDIEDVYQAFLEAGGVDNDMESFATYLSSHAPIYRNWQKLAVAVVERTHEGEVVRFEHLGEVTCASGHLYTDLYTAYIDIDGSEVPIVTISSRTGAIHHYILE